MAAAQRAVQDAARKLPDAPGVRLTDAQRPSNADRERVIAAAGQAHATFGVVSASNPLADAAGPETPPKEAT
ncbi:MAG: hypothetical protein A3E25_10920 [Burkholderiales bacterium RIFCSPHIGHO2_12_FULL_69_20]|nr:MAG: hypothetical protein A3E25_10920 [Burkholderiales bacterium RIFCSPHIGHO2_12_FULL_69_20]